MTAVMHDILAEQNVIASCLVDADAVERCANTGLIPEEFFTLRSRYSYAAIQAVTDAHGADAVNRVTVGYELAQRSADDGTTRRRIDIVTLSWLSQIEADLVTSVGAEWYAGIVRECAQRRRLEVATQQVAQLAASGDPDATRKAAALLGELAGTAVVKTSASRQAPRGGVLV